MNTEDIVEVVEETKEKLLKAEPQSLTYEQVLSNLTGHIDRYLNPTGQQIVGFACFIFPLEEPTKQASIIANCQRQTFYPLLRKFTSSLSSKLRKRNVN